MLLTSPFRVHAPSLANGGKGIESGGGEHNSFFSADEAFYFHVKSIIRRSAFVRQHRKRKPVSVGPEPIFGMQIKQEKSLIS